MAKTRAEALAAVAILYPNTTPAPCNGDYAPKPQPEPTQEPPASAQLTLFPDAQTGVDHAITH